MQGKVVTVSGEPQAGVTIAADGRTVASEADGRYSIELGTSSQRLVLAVSDASGTFAPTSVIVNRKDGVERYARNVIVVAAMQTTFDVTEGDTVTVTSSGRPAVITVPPDAFDTEGLVTLTAAGFSADDGPGALESADEPDSERLQTLGMVYVQAEDEQGTPLALAPGAAIGVQFAPYELMEIPDAQELSDFQLNEDTRWQSLKPTMTSATGAQLVAQSLGYWNADRAYRTACVKGRVRAPSKSCAGEQVTVHSYDGISSSDSISAAGEFCVNGPQTISAMTTIGSKGTSLTFPKAPGNCATALDACKDVGDIDVTDSDCTLGGTRNPPGKCEDGTYLVTEGDHSCGGTDIKGFSGMFTVKNGMLSNGTESAPLGPDCEIESPISTDACGTLTTRIVLREGGDCQIALTSEQCCKTAPCTVVKQ